MHPAISLSAGSNNNKYFKTAACRGYIQACYFYPILCNAFGNSDGRGLFVCKLIYISRLCVVLSTLSLLCCTTAERPPLSVMPSFSPRISCLAITQHSHRPAEDRTARCAKHVTALPRNNSRGDMRHEPPPQQHQQHRAGLSVGRCLPGSESGPRLHWEGSHYWGLIS